VRESKIFRVWFGATLLMCAVFCSQVCSAQEKQSALLQERVSTSMTILPTVSAPLPMASFLLPQNPGKSPTHITWQFAGTYESYHPLERLPRMEKVRTLFFTQSSLPLTQLWSGRLHLDAFQNTLQLQKALQVQNPRSAHLFGLSASFQFGQGARAERPTQSWRSLFRTALN
jgi:hypothetical protein